MDVPFPELEEEWRPVDIAGVKAGYEVSSLGRVRSPNGILSPSDTRKNSHGHLQICLVATGEKRRRTFVVHRLVLTAFVGPAPTRETECRHLNGISRDNRLVNLQWGSTRENVQDKHRHGTIPRGTDHPYSKLNDESVRYIRASKKSATELGRELGVCEFAIRAIRKGLTWRHVS